MSAKKNTRPDIAVSERAKETGPTFQSGPHSYPQSTTSLPPGQRVSDFLLPGRGNAIPLKRLKELLDLDGRKIRLMVRAERLRGVPICEDSKNGYYLPQNTDERDLCAKRLRHRASEIAKIASAIAAADIAKGAADIVK